MAITVVTPAASYALASLHEARRALDLASLVGADLAIDATAKTVTRAGYGSFVQDGFAAGVTIGMAGFANGANNDLYPIASLTDKVLTLSDPDNRLIDEGSGTPRQVYDVAKDEALTRALRTTTDFLEAITGRRFVREQIKETFQGPNVISDFLYVSLRPVVSLVGVTLDGNAVSGCLIDNATTGRIFNPASFEPYFTQTTGGINLTPSPLGRRTLWEIEYVGGFLTDDLDPVNRDLPYDLEHWSLAIATAFAQTSHATQAAATAALQSGIAGEHLGDWSATYRAPSEQDQTFVGVLSQALLGLRPWTEIEIA